MSHQCCAFGFRHKTHWVRVRKTSVSLLNLPGFGHHSHRWRNSNSASNEFFFFFSWGVILIKPRHWLQMFVSSAVAGHCLMMILNKISETLRKHSSFFYPQVCWKGCLGSREAVSSEIFGGFQGYSVSHVPRLDCMSATISRGSPNTGTAFVLTASK